MIRSLPTCAPTLEVQQRRVLMCFNVRSSVMCLGVQAERSYIETAKIRAIKFTARFGLF